VVGGGVLSHRVCTAHRSNGLPRSGSSSGLVIFAAEGPYAVCYWTTLAGLHTMYAAGVMAVLLGGSRSRVGIWPLLLKHRRRLLALLFFAAALQIRRRYHDLHLFALLYYPYPYTLPIPPPPIPLPPPSAACMFLL
jgi:hypothetical protein